MGLNDVNNTTSYTIKFKTKKNAISQFNLQETLKVMKITKIIYAYN